MYLSKFLCKPQQYDCVASTSDYDFQYSHCFHQIRTLRPPEERRQCLIYSKLRTSQLRLKIKSVSRNLYIQASNKDEPIEHSLVHRILKNAGILPSPNYVHISGEPHIFTQHTHSSPMPFLLLHAPHAPQPHSPLTCTTLRHRIINFSYVPPLPVTALTPLSYANQTLQTTTAIWKRLPPSYILFIRVPNIQPQPPHRSHPLPPAPQHQYIHLYTCMYIHTHTYIYMYVCESHLLYSH